MPEAPELEVARELLDREANGATVLSASVLRPSVLRPLAGDLASDIPGRVIEAVRRRGKFLIFQLSGGRALVANPMLTGAFQYCLPDERVFKRTCIVLSLSNGRELRYIDDRQMGRVYYIQSNRLAHVPQFEGQGPDVLEHTSLEEFKRRLSRFHGEIKGVLTRGRVISGIGNAYADEILFAAQIYPFRKRRQLTDDELRRLLEHSRSVVEDAIELLRERMGQNIHVKKGTS